VDERERFIRGTLAGALFVCAAGAGLLVLAGRLAGGLAFAAGTAVSLANFRLIAAAVGRAGSEASWRDVWRGSLVRFALAGAALFVILVVLRAPILPFAAGLVLAQVWMIGHWLWVSLRALPGEGPPSA